MAASFKGPVVIHRCGPNYRTNRVDGALYCDKLDPMEMEEAKWTESLLARLTSETGMKTMKVCTEN
jgi:hypothetical protein